MQLLGKISKILPVETGPYEYDRNWKRQDFIVETIDKFPKVVCVSVFNENIEKLKNFLVLGFNVAIHFTLQSREVEGVWKTTVKVWKIERLLTGLKVLEVEDTDNDNILLMKLEDGLKIHFSRNIHCDGGTALFVDEGDRILPGWHYFITAKGNKMLRKPDQDIFE